MNQPLNPSIILLERRPAAIRGKAYAVTCMHTIHLEKKSEIAVPGPTAEGTRLPALPTFIEEIRQLLQRYGLAVHAHRAMLPQKPYIVERPLPHRTARRAHGEAVDIEQTRLAGLGVYQVRRHL